MYIYKSRNHRVLSWKCHCILEMAYPFFFLQNKIYKLAAQRLAFFCTLYTIIKNACAQYIKV